MRLIYGCDEAVSRFVAANISWVGARGFGECTAIGVAHADQLGDCLVGGFVFNEWSPEFGVIEVSFAGIDKRWLTRAVLYGMFSYVFDDIGCQMACSRTPVGLRHAVRICQAYGFKQVTVPRLFGRDQDGIISTLTAEDWRANGFHKENADEQRQGAKAA